VSLFGRRRGGTGSHGARTLPENIVDLMATFGRYEFDPTGSTTDPGFIWNEVCAPLLPIAQADTPGFLRALANAVLPAGSWSVYGGSRLVQDLLGGDVDDVSYHAMLEASLDFLRALGVPRSRLNGYEDEFWRRTRGRTEPWLTSRPLPSDPDLTPLAPGESRRIAQVERGDQSNAVIVRVTDTGVFEALIDARRSDDDRRRVTNLWKTASSQYDLYRDVAESFQVPCFWVDPQLEPFFPYARPAVD
jgi:hypothetical protein